MQGSICNNYAHKSRFEYWSDENGSINVVEILDQNVICKPLFKECGHKSWFRFILLKRNVEVELSKVDN